jgi:hypothetical protein
VEFVLLDVKKIKRMNVYPQQNKWKHIKQNKKKRMKKKKKKKEKSKEIQIK